MSSIEEAPKLELIKELPAITPDVFRKSRLEILLFILSILLLFDTYF